MNSEEYVESVHRTVSNKLNFDAIDQGIVQGVIGICKEGGELLDAVYKTANYGAPLDIANVIEELGDISWYMSRVIKALGITWEDIWELNIQKLQKRYPEEWTKEAALNRDIPTELNPFQTVLGRVNGYKISRITFDELTERKEGDLT